MTFGKWYFEAAETLRPPFMEKKSTNKPILEYCLQLDTQQSYFFFQENDILIELWAPKDFLKY